MSLQKSAAQSVQNSSPNAKDDFHTGLQNVSHLSPSTWDVIHYIIRIILFQSWIQSLFGCSEAILDSVQVL